MKQGGTVKRDGTPAILHKDERVLTAPLTKKLDVAVDEIYRAAKGGKGDKDKDKKKGRKPRKYGDFNYIEPGASSADYPYTWFDTAQLKNKGKQSGVPDAGAGNANTVKAATYNVLFGTSLKETQQDLTNLMGSANILSLQELASQKNNVLPWIKKQGWGIYRPRAGAGIAWNKDVYKATGLKSQRLADYPIAHNYATYGKFIPQQGGGRPFHYGSAHTIWRTGAPPATQQRVKMEQYRTLGRLNQRLSAGGAPFILGGDFNNSGTPIPVIEKMIGMKSNRARGIDHLFYNGAVKGGKVTTRNLHSDHNAVLSQFNIPALAKGAENIRWDNTIANLHKGESVLTADLSEKFKRGVDNFASGGDSTYNVNVNVTNPNASADEIANVVITKLQRAEARKPKSRRG